MEKHAQEYPLSDLSRRILASAIQVHRTLGPGLLENAYRACLRRQLALDGLSCQEEVPVAVSYNGIEVADAYRADIIVEQSILLELKAVERLLSVHDAQILTYLRLSGLRVGLLLNFNVTRLKHGIRRFIV
jgi:GxxExxY protein